LLINRTSPCLHWFNGEKGALYAAVGADGAPSGKDHKAIAYLVSILNLLNNVAIKRIS